MVTLNFIKGTLFLSKKYNFYIFVKKQKILWVYRWKNVNFTKIKQNKSNTVVTGEGGGGGGIVFPEDDQDFSQMFIY